MNQNKISHMHKVPTIESINLQKNMLKVKPISNGVKMVTLITLIVS